jgi:hypothetical protein
VVYEPSRDSSFDDSSKSGTSLGEDWAMGVMDRTLAGLRYLGAWDTPGRRLVVRPDDVFLVSYPKSGNTWVRLLAANLTHPTEAVSLLGADRIVPNVDGQSRKYFEQMSRPRIIKSHYPFCQTYKRVIYVVRDPRDVAVSQYHFQIKRRVLEEESPIDEFIPKFITGEVCGYGSWGENVASWLGARLGDPNFLLVRYEDLLRQTLSEVERIATHLSLASTPELLTLAVERSSAKRMREMEKQEGTLWASTKNTRQDLSFVRSASDRQWCSKLSRESVARIEEAWGELMDVLGYQLAVAENFAESTERTQETPQLVLQTSGFFPALLLTMRKTRPALQFGN